MNPNQIQENILKANDLSDYQDHIAWKGIIEPWLLGQKQKFQAYLVDVVLSNRPLPLDNGQLLTAERCAAYVEAIDGLFRMFSVINRKRDSALEQLQDNDLFDLKDIENE